ncbi:MAG TPA: type II toxin-antitoxin system VapC family toxin [Polyangia bacterium]
MTYFLDASALVKRYVREPGSERIQALVRRQRQLVISRLTAVELPAAIWKRSRAGDLSATDARRLLARFEGDLALLTTVEPRPPTIQLAADLVERHPLRAYDAVQLASALRWARETRLATCFVCADRGLAGAAAKERLRQLTLA